MEPNKNRLKFIMEPKTFDFMAIRLKYLSKYKIGNVEKILGHFGKSGALNGVLPAHFRSTSSKLPALARSRSLKGNLNIFLKSSSSKSSKYVTPEAGSMIRISSGLITSSSCFPS